MRMHALSVRTATKRVIVPCLGACAARALSQAHTAQVWGVTRAGVFLHLSPTQIIFLSAEPYKGPLTIQISQPGALSALKYGVRLEVRRGNIVCDNLKVVTNTAETWSAGLPGSNTPGVGERLEFISNTVLNSYDEARRGVADIDPATIFIAGMPGRLNPSPLVRLLGCGPGLTPAGDDFILGFLLAMNRWGAHFTPELNLAGFNQSILWAAQQRTTLLSLNLLECACLGEADERLVIALDGILTGQPDPGQCDYLLKSWGHSSGLNVFMGMALAINIWRLQEIL